MSFPNPDNYARDCDCGTAGANTTPPPASLVAALIPNPLLLPLGGSIDTRNLDGSGGYIKTSGDTSGNAGGYIDTSATNGGSNGGYINTTGSDGAGGYIDTRGSNQGYDGGSINTSAGDAQGGSINTTGGSEGAGGSINTSDRGGSINTSGGNSGGGGGGSINTSGLENEDGGSINTSAGATGEGGSINTSNDGGSINTRGVGSIQLGVSATRTTLNGSATAARTVTLPNITGTLPIALISASTALNFGSISTGSFVDLTITLTGAQLDDWSSVNCVSIRGSADGSRDLIFSSFVSAVNIVTVRAHNPTAGSINPNSYNFKVAIIKTV